VEAVPGILKYQIFLRRKSAGGRRESFLENRLGIECDLHVITYNQSAAFQD